MANYGDADSELEAVQAIFPEIINGNSTSKNIIFSCNNGNLLIVLTNLYVLEYVLLKLLKLFFLKLF